MLEDFTRLNEAFGINEPMFLPEEENIEYIDTYIPTFAGKKHTEETKRLMSIASKGKKKSQEHCDNMAKAFARSYKLTFKDGSDLIITNMKKFCRESKYHTAHLRGVMLGKRKTHFDVVAVEEVSIAP